MSKNPIAPLTFAALALCALSAPIAAQTAAPTTQAAFLHNPSAIKWESCGNDKVMKIVEADTPSGQAISARTKKRKSKAWDIALWVDMDEGTEKGDLIEMQFWARTDKAPRGKDAAELIVFVGRNEEPHDYIISEDFSPSNEWKLHTLTGTANANFAPGKVKAEYQLGKNAQTVEFGAMYVKNLGPQGN